MRVAIRLVLGVVLLAVLAGAGYAGVWFYAANAAESQVREWAKAREADGYQITIGAITTAGFPQTIAMTARDVAVAKPNDPIAWRWTAESIVANRKVYGSSNVAVAVVGNQTLAYRIGPDEKTARIQTRRFAIDVRPGNNALIIDIAALILTPDADAAPITMKSGSFRVTLGDGDAAIPEGTRTIARIDTLVIPDNRRGPLGDTIDLLTSDFTMSRALDTFSLPGALDRWRLAKGYLNLKASELRWGTLNMAFTGLLSVDDQYRPTGYLNATIKDFSQAIDAFFAAGRIDAKARADVTTMMGFLQSRGGGGGVGLPIEITAGEVDVGAMKLGTVPPLFPRLSP